MTQDEARARVARGAALLDAKLPGWAGRVDIGLLSIESIRDCIVCQTAHKNFIKGLRVLGAYDDPAMFGFGRSDEDRVCDKDGYWIGWRLLQNEWIQQIADRVVPKGQPEPVPVEVEA